MAAATENPAARELLRQFEPELLKLLTSPPAYGSVTVSLIFHAGEVAKIETGFSLLRKTGGRP